MSTFNIEMLIAVVEGKGNRSPHALERSSGGEGAEAVTLPFSSNDSLTVSRSSPPLGIIPVLGTIRDELSTVIDQAKAALMSSERIGFLQPGFKSVSIVNLIDVVKEGLLHSEMIVNDPRNPPAERIVAINIEQILEKFQFSLFGLEPESLGRTEVKSLLPVLLELKQVCMELELKLLLGMGSVKELLGEDSQAG